MTEKNKVLMGIVALVLIAFVLIFMMKCGKNHTPSCQVNANHTADSIKHKIYDDSLIRLLKEKDSVYKITENNTKKVVIRLVYVKDSIKKLPFDESCIYLQSRLTCPDSLVRTILNKDTVACINLNHLHEINYTYADLDLQSTLVDTLGKQNYNLLSQISLYRLMSGKDNEYIDNLSKDIKCKDMTIQRLTKKNKRVRFVNNILLGVSAGFLLFGVVK